MCLDPNSMTEEIMDKLIDNWMRQDSIIWNRDSDNRTMFVALRLVVANELSGAHLKTMAEGNKDVNEAIKVFQVYLRDVIKNQVLLVHRRGKDAIFDRDNS